MELDSSVHSSLYTGRVRHRRLWPVRHQFSYGVFMVHLDLAELDEIFRGRWLWSTKRFSLAWFRRADHEGDPREPLDTTIRNLVEARTGHRPVGPVTLLTNLRYFGYCMNPVSFYYCWNEARSKVRTIVAEVHNTPWRERHCYVLDSTSDVGRAGHHRFQFAKAFHVSPFMPMHHRYDWRFTDPGEKLAVHMENMDTAQGGRKVFDSTMSLTRRPITAGNLARVLLRHPFMTGKVIAAIYWQALWLRLKGAPFHPHPKLAAPSQAGIP